MELVPHISILSAYGGYIVNRTIKTDDGEWAQQAFVCSTIGQVNRHVTECLELVDANEDLPGTTRGFQENRA